MVTKAKPKPKYVKLEKEEKRSALDEHRDIQRKFAVARDGGLCVMCYFSMGIKERATEVHHVYGRAQQKESWKENFLFLMCLCKEHHNKVGPIKGDAPSDKSLWVEQYRYLANNHPICTDLYGRAAPPPGNDDAMMRHAALVRVYSK